MNKKALIYILIIFIVFIAFILRIANINDTLNFGYDQGRDALIIKNILGGRFTLIGPTTGIPGFFLGPFYYYFIILPYLIFKGNPIGPAIFLIFLNVIGIIFTAHVIKENKNWTAFIICLFLLTINFSNIRYSRWLSNPNPILWLSPIYFYLLYFHVSTKKAIKFWHINSTMLMGFILGILFQTELANALFFLPTTVFIFLVLRKNINIKSIIKFFIGIFITLIPLILFNLRHDFIMLIAFKNFFSNNSEKISLIDVIKQRPDFYSKTLSFFLTGNKQDFLLFLCFIIIIFLILKKFWLNKKLLILFSWLVVPLVLMLFYTSNNGVIWDYYLISQPTPFIMLLSLALTELKNKFKYAGYFIIGVILILFSYLNLKEWYILVNEKPHGISFKKMKQSVDWVYRESLGKPFNVEVFVPNLLPSSYEYLFEWYGKEKYKYLPTISDKRERLVFFIMEPGQKYKDGEQYWRNWWYNKRKNIGQIVNTYSTGEIDVEKRERLSL